jgi:tRNA threonylcarbamoyladenosine biosynthesis protein TsaE
MAASRRPDLDVITHSPDQTRRLGTLLGRRLGPGALVLLAGDLGSGKTTFAQGVGKGLGVREGLQSPTFTLVSEHDVPREPGRPSRLYHVDLYRLPADDPDETMTIGLEDYLHDRDAATVIEWPGRASAFLPAEYLIVRFEHLADTKRQLRFAPRGLHYLALVDGLRGEVAAVRRG